MTILAAIKAQLTGRRLVWNILFYVGHLAIFAYGWIKQAQDLRLAGLNTLRYSVWSSRGAGLCLGVDGLLLVVPDVNMINVERTQIRKETAWAIMYTQPGGFTGHMMLLIMFVMYTTAHRRIRHQAFEVFWYTHHLSVLFLLCLYIHATGCFVRGALPDQPVKCLGYNSWRWTIWAGGAYAVERMIREVRARRSTKLVGVLAFPAGVIELRFVKPSMNFKAGQWLFLNVPNVSKWQWHPFTISSAPGDAFISIHIRQVGDWTRTLGGLLGCDVQILSKQGALASSKLDGKRDEKTVKSFDAGSLMLRNGANLPAIKVDGPYGSPAEDVFRHEVAVLVATGIGVTPFASILKNIWYMQQQRKLGFLRRVQFIWVTREVEHFRWFHKLLDDLEQIQTDPDFLRINMYLTQVIDEDTIANIAINETNVEDDFDPLTQLQSRTHFGRPNFHNILNTLAAKIESGAYLPGRETSLQTSVGDLGGAGARKFHRQRLLAGGVTLPTVSMAPWSIIEELNAKDLVTTTGQAAVAGVLQALTAGQQPDVESRRKLIQAILAAVACSQDKAALGLLSTTLKVLGRDSNGSEQLGTKQSLRLLATKGGLLRLGNEIVHTSYCTATLLPPATPDDNEDEEQERIANSVAGLEQRTLLEPYEAEFLRCLCNALMLHPQARQDWPEVLDDDIGRTCIKGMSRTLKSREAGFLGGRLLFLLTSQPSRLVSTLISDGVTVPSMQDYATRYLNTLLDERTATLLSSGPMPTHADTLREQLKMVYNLMLQFSRDPKVDEASLPVSARSSNEEPRRGSLGGNTSDISVSAAEESFSAPSKSPRPRLKRILSGLSGKNSSMSNGNSNGDKQASESGITTSGPTSPARETFEMPPVALDDKPNPTPPAKSTARKIVDAVKNTASSRPSTPVSQRHTSPLPTAPSRAQDSAPHEAGSLTLAQVKPLMPLFKPYLHLCCLLPIGDDSKDPSPLLRSALNTLLNFPVELEELDGFDNSWMQPVRGSEGVVDYASLPLVPGLPTLPPLLARLVEILLITSQAWFPSDGRPPPGQLTQGKAEEPPHTPDDLILRDDTTKVEEILSPVMLLLRKVTLLAEAAFLLKKTFLPEDIDRTVPLDRRPDLIGHLIRLTSSIMLPNTAYGAAELLYNLCERNPEMLASQIGYGNAAGLLQNRGELIPPPAPPSGESAGTDGAQQKQISSKSLHQSEASSDRTINPITGAFENESSARDDLAHMTDEEKEREAEKLYVLFDRMNRTGVVSALDNPVDKAKREGKLEQSAADKEQERQRLEQEDEELEREVARDLAQYKAKKAEQHA
ncbi:hypothetical protein OIO90_003604 [Microbotryomycetes sp. JL221]|nr:hypothetical protein OIO90_003604 [Microbotryomycetes sp. JL221]